MVHFGDRIQAQNRYSGIFLGEMGYFWGHIGLYKDNGKENGSYSIIVIVPLR